MRDTRILSLLVFIISAHAAGPTLTLGPASEYSKPPKETASPQTNDLVITPINYSNEIPKDGIDILFGPDLRTSLEKAANDNCGKGLTQDCANAVSGLLNKDYDLTLETRQLGIGAGIGAALIGILSLIWGVHNEPPAIRIEHHYHLPASDVSQIQAQTGSSVVIETSKGAPAVTITAAPTPTLKPAPAAITTLSADKDGHAKGDILISLPPRHADILKQLVAQTGIRGECKRTEKRQSGPAGLPSNYDYINNAALFILPMAAPGELLAAFGLQLEQLPQLLLRLRDDAAQASLQYVQDNAEEALEFAKIAADQSKALAAIVWKITYDFCIDDVDAAAEIVMESSLFLDDPAQEGDQDDENKKCPKDKKNRPLCDNPECAGAKGKCWRNCPCLQTAKVFRNEISEEDMNQFQEMLIRSLEGQTKDEGKPGQLDCDKDNRVTLEYADFVKLSNAFCKDLDLKNDKMDTKITPKDAGTRGPYRNYEFSFSWKAKPEGTCTRSCEEIFASFNSSSVCAYDSHTMSETGSQVANCGTASFKFSDGKPRPDPSPPKDPTVPVLTCGKRTDVGNPKYFVALASMNRATHFFCQQQVNLKTRFEPGKPPATRKLELNYNGNKNDPVFLSAEWLTNVPGCPITDFGAPDFLKVCEERIGFITNTCDTSNPGKKYHWKQGGSLTKDCVRWTIRRDEFRTNDYPLNQHDSWRPIQMDCALDTDCEVFCRYSSGPFCRIEEKVSDQGWCECKGR